MIERNWYLAHQNKDLLHELEEQNIKVVNNHVGFPFDPTYEQFEKYDLRYIDTCTTDELFNGYF